MSLLLDASQPLIIAGKPRFGQFQDALAVLARDNFRYQNAFGEEKNRLSQWLGCKDFQYFGGMSERFIFGCALAHLRYVGVAFVYVYDCHHQKLWSRSWRSPLGVGLNMADNPVSGQSRFKLAGLVDIRMSYQAEPRVKTLGIRCAELQLDAEMPEDQLQPMSLCTRTGYSGWTYTNKSAGQPLLGTLRWQNQDFDLSALGAYGAHDYSCGYMRRETWWNWACFAGTISEGPRQGQRVGLNLSTGVNETGFSENCLWLNGELHRLPFAQFSFNSDQPLQPWHIEAHEGQLQLDFEALGMHRELMRAGLVTSHFRQIFGEFKGCVTVNGEQICLNGIKGFVEDQFVRW